MIYLVLNYLIYRLICEKVKRYCTVFEYALQCLSNFPSFKVGDYSRGNVKGVLILYGDSYVCFGFTYHLQVWNTVTFMHITFYKHFFSESNYYIEYLLIHLRLFLLTYLYLMKLKLRRITLIQGRAKRLFEECYLIAPRWAVIQGVLLSEDYYRYKNLVYRDYNIY